MFFSPPPASWALHSVTPGHREAVLHSMGAKDRPDWLQLRQGHLQGHVGPVSPSFSLPVGKPASQGCRESWAGDAPAVLGPGACLVGSTELCRVGLPSLLSPAVTTQKEEDVMAAGVTPPGAAAGLFSPLGCTGHSGKSGTAGEVPGHLPLTSMEQSRD